MPAARQAPNLFTRMQEQWNADAAQQHLDLGPLGVHPAGTWLQHARSLTGTAQDELLAALLCQAGDGEVAAAEVLLHALIPAVTRATATLHSADEYTPSDRAGAVVAATWEAIHCHRPGLTTHVFITLLRAARQLLAPPPTANQRHIADRTTTVDTLDLIVLAGPQPTPAVPAEVRLAAVLSWARDTHILTMSEIELLTRVTIHGDDITDTAARLDTTVTALRKRIQRTQLRLRAAVQAQCGATPRRSSLVFRAIDTPPRDAYTHVRSGFLHPETKPDRLLTATYPGPVELKPPAQSGP